MSLRYSRWMRAAAVISALVFLSGCGKKTNGAQAQQMSFDGARAFDLLKKQCSFGPRYTGTKGYASMLDFLQSELVPSADKVIADRFTAEVAGKKLEFTNVYAVFNPDASHFVLLCAHWDTRPVADQEVDAEKRKQPILGANDGASETAVLLELAKMFHEKKPSTGVIMAFFDGEDYAQNETEMFAGSTEFARNWKKKLAPAINSQNPTIDYGILLDMIGDKDLSIPKEIFSVLKAPEVVDKVWSAAKRAGHGDVFQDKMGYGVNDDHVPINEIAGIKCIDVIDFDYAYWHTLDDTVDKCSPKSLKIVGDVIAQVIYAEKSVSAK